MGYETQGQAIPPTPVVGGVGLFEDAAKAVNIAFKDKGEAIVAIGTTAGHLGQSLYLREITGRADGPPPPQDRGLHRVQRPCEESPGLRPSSVEAWIRCDGLRDWES